MDEDVLGLHAAGPWAGQAFTSRKARIEQFEKLKKRLQDDLDEIDKKIKDLKEEEDKTV